MNAKSIRVLLAVLALALFVPSAWSQENLTRLDGRITDSGKSLVGVQVVLSHQDTLQVFRATTDKYGTFSISDVARGAYVVSILNATGDKLFRKTLDLTSASDAPIRLDLDVSGAPVAQPSIPQQPDAAKAQPDKSSKTDPLIAQYEAAVRANDNPAAIAALKSIVAADPTRWDYFDTLGNLQTKLGDYENSAQSFDKGVQAAQQLLASPPSDGSLALKSDRDRVTAGIAQMLLNEGNAWLKLKKNPEAVAAYTKAAELASDPANAYFNLCIVHYNTRNLDSALDACNKAIAANPSLADAYFMEGTLLFSSVKSNKDGSLIVAPGTVEALKKYLQLAPTGAYVKDVKKMLDYLGARVP